MVGEEVHRRQNDTGKGHGEQGGGKGGHGEQGGKGGHGEQGGEGGRGGGGRGRKGAFPPTLGGPGNQCPV